MVMRTRLFAQSTLGLALILATPSVACAYSLGEIRVTSQLGEAFYAEIPLHLREGESVKDFLVALGNLEEYLVLELHRSPVTVQLDVKVRMDSRGPRVVLKSDSPIQEPFFNLLLKTTLGSGSHFRNFPIFLDMKSVKPVASPLPREPKVVATQEAPRADKGVRRKAREVAAAPVAPVNMASSGGDYGPVRPGENLLTIARQLQGYYPGIPEGQLAAAIWRRNQGAFARGNINALRAGVILNLPEAAEATKLSSRETREIMTQQYREWQGDGLSKTRPAPKESAKADAKPPAKAPAPPEEKPAPSGALPPGEARRHEEKTAQPTQQPKSEPPKPQAAAAPVVADKKVAFEQRVTMQEGDAAAKDKSGSVAVEAGKPVTAAAAPPTQKTAQDTTAASPGDAATAESMTLQLSKSLSRLETLEGELNKATNALNTSEKARTKLQSSLTALQQRMDQLEKEKTEADLKLQDMLLYGAGGLGVLVLGGILALFTRRRKPMVALASAAVPEPTPAPAPEPSSRRASHFGTAMAGVAVGAATVAIAADQETTLSQTRVATLDTLDDNDEVEELTPFSPEDYQEEDNLSPSHTESRASDEPELVAKPGQRVFGDQEEDSSWQTAMGIEESAPLDQNTADVDLDDIGNQMDLGNIQEDLDLDVFASRTVVGMGEGEDEQPLSFGDDLGEQGEELAGESIEGMMSLGAPPSSTVAESGNGIEELDFSTLDTFSRDNDQDQLELPAMGDDADHDVGGLFLPGASFDEEEDEQGTLEAIPLAPGPGLARQTPPIEEMDELESLDLESLGLGDEEEEPAISRKGPLVDLDLDSADMDDDLSLGNMDDALGSVARHGDGVKPIEVPAFDVVEMDFTDHAKPVKTETKPPVAGNYELDTLEFDLDEPKK